MLILDRLQTVDTLGSMKIRTASMQHARENLAELVDQVKWEGQAVSITRYNKPVVYLVSPEWFERAQRALMEGAPTEPVTAPTTHPISNS